MYVVQFKPAFLCCSFFVGSSSGDCQVEGGLYLYIELLECCLGDNIFLESLWQDSDKLQKSTDDAMLVSCSKEVFVDVQFVDH